MSQNAFGQEASSRADASQGRLGVAPGAEGIYFNYGPFTTPGFQGTSFDAGREAAVAVLGIALLTCSLLCATVVALRWLTATGRVGPNPHVPVRLAIAAFLAGLVAVLWGAFFLPLAGDNPGMLYGDEDPQSLSDDTEGILETTRYANVGFFLGIAGAIGFPAYLWIDAARARFLAGEPTPKATDSWIATPA